MTADRRTWVHRALCRDEDPELFQPVGNTGPALLQIAEAKAVCRRCPVVAPCLDDGLARIPHGVLGGMSEDERAVLKRRRADQRRRSEAARLRAQANLFGPAVAARDAIRAGMGTREVAEALGVTHAQALEWAAEAKADAS